MIGLGIPMMITPGPYPTPDGGRSIADEFRVFLGSQFDTDKGFQYVSVHTIGHLKFKSDLARDVSS